MFRALQIGIVGALSVVGCGGSGGSAEPTVGTAGSNAAGGQKPVVGASAGAETLGGGSGSGGIATGGAGAGGGGAGGGVAGMVTDAGVGGGPETPQGPTIRVLQLNVWQEGSQVQGGLKKIAAVILATRADVVAFSEVRNYGGEDWTTKLLAELAAQAPAQPFYGKFFGGDVGLASRFPLTNQYVVFDETAADAGSIIAWTLQVPKAVPLTIASAHLDYQHYALNWVRGYEGGGSSGWGERPNNGTLVHETDSEVLLTYNRQSRRDEAIAAFTAFAASRLKDQAVVLSGDFNEGSDLDWTARAENESGHYGAVIPWDNSLALAHAGFHDAYRVVHPDELQFPGFTWPAPADGKTTTSWALKSDERDRIDFIYVHKNQATPQAAWIVGPRTTFIGTEKAPNPGLDDFLGDALPWPTDHKGVLVSVELAPAP